MGKSQINKFSGGHVGDKVALIGVGNFNQRPEANRLTARRSPTTYRKPL